MKRLATVALTLALSAPGGTAVAHETEPAKPRQPRQPRTPEMVRLVHRYGRVHHDADFSRFRDLSLIRRPDFEVPKENPYRTRVVARSSPRGGPA